MVVPLVSRIERIWMRVPSTMAVRRMRWRSGPASRHRSKPPRRRLAGTSSGPRPSASTCSRTCRRKRLISRMALLTTMPNIRISPILADESNSLPVPQKMPADPDQGHGDGQQHQQRQGEALEHRRQGHEDEDAAVSQRVCFSSSSSSSVDLLAGHVLDRVAVGQLDARQDLVDEAPAHAVGADVLPVDLLAVALVVAVDGADLRPLLDADQPAQLHLLAAAGGHGAAQDLVVLDLLGVVEAQHQALVLAVDHHVPGRLDPQQAADVAHDLGHATGGAGPGPRGRGSPRSRRWRCG